MRADITLHNQDCMEAMKDMPDNAFELAIVDPPYGIGMDGATGSIKTNRKKYTFKGWDNEIPSKEYFDELQRVSVNQIIWGGNYFGDILGKCKCMIVWDKIQRCLGNEFEFAWTSLSLLSKAFRKSRVQSYVGVVKIHPTQKPVQLYKWLLQNYAKEGDKILDTHGGSMSIALACWDLGFDLDLWEIDKEYFDDGKLRLERHQAQGQLF